MPSPFAVMKAERLLREQLPCLGCHAFGDEGGRLAPDLKTVRQRRSPEYIAAMVADPQRLVPGSLMPRTAMLPATRDAIVRYLTAQPGGADAAQPGAGDATQPGRALTAQPGRALMAQPGGALATQPAGALATPAAVGSTPSGADGAALYARWCAACHGSRGMGDGPNASRLPVKPAAHADASAMAARSDDALYDTIAGGGAIMNRSPRMPAFGETLTPAQLRALVEHIRRLCACSGPAWSRP